MNNDLIRDLRGLCLQFGEELDRPRANEIHFVLHAGADLRTLVVQLMEFPAHRPDTGEFALVTAFSNDERELEDGSFKLYCIFAHSRADLFLWIEYLLPREERSTQNRQIYYPSLAEVAPAVIPFQREMADLMGLFPEGISRALIRNHLLHGTAYPPDLFPLRRDRSMEQLVKSISEWEKEQAEVADDHEPFKVLETGEIVQRVGPVHAGIIEPGRFDFRVVGDEIRELTIKLGFTHKGIERLFQSGFTLLDGWKLAERVSGDSSFSHALAYCYAVESLSSIAAPLGAEFLRALFVETERITNHIGDIAAIAHDVGFDLISSPLAVLKEKMLRFNASVGGHRLLRGLNRPGGMCLPAPLAVRHVKQTVEEVVSEFLDLARLLIESNGFRERVSRIGVLTADLAKQFGATGFVARSSRGRDHDFRLAHPYGIYQQSKYHDLLQSALQPEKALFFHPLEGDVLARVQLRIEESYTSSILIQQILADYSELSPSHLTSIDPTLDHTPNNIAALGYVEGWRGDIIYWIMKDKFERIYRCKVCDPSSINWPALVAAINPHSVHWQAELSRSSLADFPVINKSFNLSYSGNDL